MAAQAASVRLRGRFPAGAKVGLFDRRGDTFNPGESAVKAATVDKNGEVEFDGLEDGAVFFVAAEVDGTVRSAAVTAKVRPARKAASTATPGTFDPQLVAQGPDSTVTGARGTKAVSDLDRWPDSRVGEPTPKKDLPDEPQPHPRQEDAQGVNQRSATFTGEAHPVDPDEPQPKLRQDAVPAGTPQMSDTPLGEATVIEGDEVQPAVRQEDAKAKLEQRSATETGEVTPVPQDDPLDPPDPLAPASDPAARPSVAGAKLDGEAAPKPKKPAARKRSKPAAKKPAAKKGLH